MLPQEKVIPSLSLKRVYSSLLWWYWSVVMHYTSTVNATFHFKCRQMNMFVTLLTLTVCCCHWLSLKLSSILFFAVWELSYMYGRCGTALSTVPDILENPEYWRTGVWSSHGGKEIDSNFFEKVCSTSVVAVLEHLVMWKNVYIYKTESHTSDS